MRVTREEVIAAAMRLREQPSSKTLSATTRRCDSSRVVSVVLVVVQGFVVGAWCSLCLLTAAISLALVFLAFDEVWASILFLRRTWRATHDWRMLWTVFRGGAHPAAAAVALERN